MAVLDCVPRLDSGVSLPVSSLSVSSLNLYARCPLAWKRRYIDKEPDRPTGKMIVGSAVGASLAQYYGWRLEGRTLRTDDVLDEFADEFAARGEEDPDWGDSPGALKDSGAALLRLYLASVASKITPVAVEREVRLSWEDVDWQVVGYLDLETADGKVVDYKTGQRPDPVKELQPDVYLAARRAEGAPATFDYHSLRSLKQPKVEVIAAPRTDAQLDALTARVFTVARSIEWRWTHDCWEGVGPDAAWLCKSCQASGCGWRRA